MASITSDENRVIYITEILNKFSKLLLCFYLVISNK